MQKAVAKEGLRAPLFCLGAVLLIANGGAATAQTVEQSDLERCASLATAELKLACFEALAASEGTRAEPAAEVAPDPLAESAAAEKALITAGAAGSDSESVVPAPTAVANDDKPDVADKAVADETGADELGREQPDQEQADIVDEIGQEHLNEEKVAEKEEVVVRATVSEVVRGGYDVLYFHFANGQVWRQLEKRRFSYPRDEEFDVIIKVGMMGDYRLRLAAGGPMTPIRRIQ